MTDRCTKVMMSCLLVCCHRNVRDVVANKRQQGYASSRRRWREREREKRRRREGESKRKRRDECEDVLKETKTLY